MSIQGLILEVRVTGCQKLRDRELFTQQDPYVVLEYGATKLRTRTCTDGGRNPALDDKFHIPLIEGLRELNVHVYNSNRFRHDDFIGSGRVHLQKVLTRGYDDSSWPLQTHNMRFAGDVKLIMHFDVSALKNKMDSSVATSSMLHLCAYPTYPTPNHPPYATQQYAPSLPQPCPPVGYIPPSYPPQPYGQPYPPPPAAQSPYPPAPYPGTYPPRPY